MNHWRDRLTQAHASTLLLRLADSLFASPVLTVPDAQRRLGVTYPSARRNVDKLIAAGIVHQMGEASYGRRFVASEILQVIGEQSL